MALWATRSHREVRLRRKTHYPCQVQRRSCVPSAPWLDSNLFVTLPASDRRDRRAVMDVCVEGSETIDQPQFVEHSPVDLVELMHLADEIRREQQFPGRLHHADAGAEDR